VWCDQVPGTSRSRGGLATSSKEMDAAWEGINKTKKDVGVNQTSIVRPTHKREKERRIQQKGDKRHLDLRSGRTRNKGKPLLKQTQGLEKSPPHPEAQLPAIPVPEHGLNGRKKNGSSPSYLGLGWGSTRGAVS